MAYSCLTDFINELEKKNELLRIKTFVDPVLEITDITDRITKEGGGKALLFENTGTGFPLLINAFGSDTRMAMAIGRENPEAAGIEIENLFNNLTDNGSGILKKLAALPVILNLSRLLPSNLRRKGSCQQVVHMEPDLGILPVLKCWPYDGGRFITLPMVHTIHPDTGKTNVGMYRMQVLDRNTTAMHWQRHKTGANHFEAWKKAGNKMPVSVALGGDPVYTYAATAPLPENINEYILAGFLRNKKVRLVKCITNSLFVPEDADIILEGYVDPAEELVWEGPFGDHTGFYSLADWYPKFHVTCITHSKKAVYPATIVGIPPQEDAWIAKVTEKIFLSPIKMAIQPEIVDFHMPEAGVAHNLVIVKINKVYPGQGMKVINSLSGAGQMMFTKYMIVVSGNVEIRNYKKLIVQILENTDFGRDVFFSHGPLDILDHSSDSFSFGGKAGIDATIKLAEENSGNSKPERKGEKTFSDIINELCSRNIVKNFNLNLVENNIPLLILSVDTSADPDAIDKVKRFFIADDPEGVFRIVVAVDHTVDTTDLFVVTWQVLGNSDPYRDHEHLSPSAIFIDGTMKAYKKGFPRKWPNVVCSDNETIEAVNNKWESLGAGPFIISPSVKYQYLCRKGRDEVIVN